MAENSAGAGTLSEKVLWQESDWEIFERTLLSEKLGELSSGLAPNKPCGPKQAMVLL